MWLWIILGVRKDESGLAKKKPANEASYNYISSPTYQLGLSTSVVFGSLLTQEPI